MGPGLFVIAILGCADGSADCRPVTTLPTQYENRSTCAAATSNALLASTGYDYPELQAECRIVPSATSTRVDRRTGNRTHG
jgi:hypothetical protein